MLGWAFFKDGEHDLGQWQAFVLPVGQDLSEVGTPIPPHEDLESVPWLGSSVPGQARQWAMPLTGRPVSHEGHFPEGRQMGGPKIEEFPPPQKP